MPTALRCTCGKQFRVADGNAGKRAKCPHCGASVLIPASLSGIAPPVGKRERGGGSLRVPSITLSPMVIVLIVAAILIPAFFLWVREGPIKAERQWAGMTQQAQDRIQVFVLRAMNVQYAAMGINPNDPDGVHPNPKVSDFNFDEPVMMLSLPEAVTFTGHTTEGTVRGTFHPHTMKFECDVEIEKAVHRVTGSTDPGREDFVFDGRPQGTTTPGKPAR